MSPKAKPRSVTAGVRSCYSDAEMKIRNRNVAFRVMRSRSTHDLWHFLFGFDHFEEQQLCAWRLSAHAPFLTPPSSPVIFKF